MAMDRQYAVINGEQVDVTTVFDTTVQYVPTREQAVKVKSECWELLDEYFPDMLNSGVGMDKMFNQDGMFWKNKGWIISAIEKHPNYNGNLQIVLKEADMSRGVNLESTMEFFRYAINYLEDVVEYTYNGKVLSYEEMRDIYRHLDFLYDTSVIVFGNCRTIMRGILDERRILTYRDKVGAIQNRIYKTMSALRNGRMVYKLQIEALKRVRRWFKEHEDDLIEKDVDAEVLVDEDLAKTICEMFDDKFYVRTGQKITKLVNKICRSTSITKHVDIQDVSFYNAAGEYVYRTKDMGWNKQYSSFTDSISPLKITGTAIISVNPYDFFTMSFGKNWASCHTIDKCNRRRVDSDHNYEGMYCGGCSSYMLDKHSIILYYLPDDWDGTEPEREDKLKRCVFYLGEDKLVQSRLYPDGRDGGDAGVAPRARLLMQKLVSELFDVPNYWTLKKGEEACRKAVYTAGVQYPDYEHYDDCNVSYLKRIDGFQNGNRIRIGEPPICPECGREHYNSRHLFCDYCKEDVYYCECCGDRIRNNDVIWVDGDPYCNDCASVCDRCEEGTTDDLTTTYNGDCVCSWCLENRYTWSEYDDDYIDDFEVVITEEGNAYAPGSDGYMECEECGEQHDIDNMVETEDERWLCLDCYEAEQEEEAEE